MRTATTFALFACAIPLLAQQVPIALHDDSLSRDTDEIRVRFECLFPSQLKMISVSAGYAAPSIDGAPQLSPALSLELELGARAARRVRPTAVCTGSKAPAFPSQHSHQNLNSTINRA